MTKYEKVARILPLLSVWQARIKELDKQMGAFFDLIGGAYDSKLGEAVEFVADGYTAAVAECVGDDAGWLAWYRHENELGARGFEATPINGGRSYKVRNVRVLARIIVESE